MKENREKIESLARDVLKLSRNTLMVNLRFLDVALNQFELYPCDDSTMLTDGKLLLFNPVHVLKNYKYEKEIPTRDFLHIVLHCIYRHMFIDPSLNRPIWDLACDIAVENAINELDLKFITTNREQRQASYTNSLKKEIKHITAEKIYRYLLDSDLSAIDSTDIRAMFYADNHEMWYMTSEEIEAKFGISSAQGMTDGQGDDTDDGDSKSTLRVKLAGEWQAISERIEQDLETFSKQQGDKAGSLIQNLKEVNREKYDYTSFLKKFATLGEVMKVNDDEFDYIFYSYGLKLYDKMPLIEPLEYKDVKRIKEFVIAIDTSGSTSGELVQKFVQKTYNILKSTESFFNKINLHIIQCDADIQKDVKITTQEEFDNYLKTMQIHGLGGTDFRPVFKYVDELIRNKEFVNLKGLIYFTDGFGDFPAKKPGYETAVVFIDDEYNNYDVPPWTIKLILQKNEI